MTSNTTGLQETSQEMTLPVDYFQIPCSEVIQTGPDEITIQISPDNLENCSEDSSFHFPFSLMATAYAQELKELIRIRLHCQYPIRVEGKKIFIQIPSDIPISSPGFELPTFVVEGTQYVISLEADETKSGVQALLRKQLLAKLKEGKLDKPHTEGRVGVEEIPAELSMESKPLKKVEPPPAGYFTADPCVDGTQFGFCEPSCADGRQCVVASQEGCWKCVEGKKKDLGDHLQLDSVRYNAFIFTLCLDAGPPVNVGLMKGSELVSLTGREGILFSNDNYYGLSATAIEESGAGTTMIRLEQRVNAKPPYTQITHSKVVRKNCIQEFPNGSKLYRYSEKHSVGIDEDPDIAQAIEAEKTQPRSFEGEFPLFAEEEFYEGDFPECVKSNGAKMILEAGIGALLEGGNGHYTLALVEGGKWNRRFEGLFALGEIKSASPEVAEVRYHRLGGLVVEAKRPGRALIRVMAGKLPNDFHPDKYKPSFKEQFIDVTVIPENILQRMECPRAALVGEEDEIGRCPVAKVEEPLFLKDAPENLDSPDQELLAEKLFHVLEKGKLSAGCDEQTLKRQARKLVSVFYAVPPPQGIASCVTCARNVANNLLAALEDEKASCIQIQNVMTHGWYGVIPPYSWVTDDVYHHEATAVGPACSPIKDNWLVFDTWRWQGQVYPFGSHQHHVEPLGVWRRTGITLKKVQTGGTYFLSPDNDIPIESLKE